MIARKSSLSHQGGRLDEVRYGCIPTATSSPLHRRSQVRSSREPLVVRTTLMIETLMMNMVKEKMPVSANFFRYSIDAFQRRFVDTKIPCALSGLIFECKYAVKYILTRSIRGSVERGSYLKVDGRIVSSVGAFTFRCGVCISTHVLSCSKSIYLDLLPSLHIYNRSIPDKSCMKPA